MATRFVRCQRSKDCTHKFPYQVEHVVYTLPLNKSHGTHWEVKALIEAADDRMEKLGCTGREFEEIMIHFTLDLEKNPKIINRIKMSVVSTIYYVILYGQFKDLPMNR